jgi:hypothetical protein
MDTSLNELLASFGSNLGSTFIYEWLKRMSGKKISVDELVIDLAKQLDCKNSAELAEKIIALLNSSNVLEFMGELGGVVRVNVANARNVTGADIVKPTRIMPGTEIHVNVTGEADTVTGLRIG